MQQLNIMFKRKLNVACNNILFTSLKISSMHEQMERLYEAARVIKGVEGQSAVARLLNASPQTVKNWETRGVSRAGMIEAQRVIGCSATWVQSGLGEMAAESRDSSEQDRDIAGDNVTTAPVGSRQIPLISCVQTQDSQLEGYITFDLLEVEAAAGAGLAAPDHPEVLIKQVNVLESWARREIGEDLKRIRLITASGDSMEPTFHDRDVLFVDESVKDYRGEGVYIIASPLPGGVQAKRLHRLLDGSMRILSDNSRLYDPETITGDDLNRLQICGKVVAAWNFKKV